MKQPLGVIAKTRFDQQHRESSVELQELPRGVTGTKGLDWEELLPSLGGGKVAKKSRPILICLGEPLLSIYLYLIQMSN